MTAPTESKASGVSVEEMDGGGINRAMHGFINEAYGLMEKKGKLDPIRSAAYGRLRSLIFLQPEVLKLVEAAIAGLETIYASCGIVGSGGGCAVDQSRRGQVAGDILEECRRYGCLDSVSLLQSALSAYQAKAGGKP